MVAIADGLEDSPSQGRVDSRVDLGRGSRREGSKDVEMGVEERREWVKVYGWCEVGGRRSLLSSREGGSYELS
jgi:hypothetical protein